MEYEAAVLVHSVARDVRALLRSNDLELIRPILMPLERMERHTAISMTYHLLANDITTPDLDVIFIQRIKDQQLAMSKIVGEIVSFDREMLRISKLEGYEQYQAMCVIHGKDPFDCHTWDEQFGPNVLDSR